MFFAFYSCEPVVCGKVLTFITIYSCDLVVCGKVLIVFRYLQLWSGCMLENVNCFSLLTAVNWLHVEKCWLFFAIYSCELVLCGKMLFCFAIYSCELVVWGKVLTFFRYLQLWAGFLQLVDDVSGRQRNPKSSQKRVVMVMWWWVSLCPGVVFQAIRYLPI